jgi:CubicO group peptidase (beta-lactamase class C family)
MTAYDFQPVADSIKQELTEQALPSLAVAAARDGEIVWEDAFGWADRENRIRATIHTPYSLASISKPITTTALMTLVEQRKLDLDKPVNDYLGNAKLKAIAGSADDATIRRIANHTSGLPLHYQFFYADEPYARPSMDETIRRYSNLVRMPGERIQYSNLGYGLLDYIIARLSGRSYASYLREAVFTPLGMFRSSVDLTPELEPYQAIRYGGDGVRYPFYDFDHPGGSAIYASAHDLVRFGMLHADCLMSDQKQILSTSTLEAMRIPTSQAAATPPRDESGFGIGWHSETDTDGVRLISHSGGMGGVTTTLLIVPQLRVVVAALANAACGLPHRAADEMLAIIQPEFGAKRKAKRDAQAAEREKQKSAQSNITFKPGKELIGEWVGAVETYNGAIPLTIRIKSTGDVHIQLGSQLKALVNDVKFQDEELKGVFVGDIGTEDANRRPYRLHLDLKLRGETLNGCVIAVTHIEQGEGGELGRRVGNALSYAAEVRRG